jgi:hypothetical protein
VKNNRDPESIVCDGHVAFTFFQLAEPGICYMFGAAGREHERSIYSDAAFFLAMAISSLNFQIPTAHNVFSCPSFRRIRVQDLEEKFHIIGRNAFAEQSLNPALTVGA